jgi:hypothetical protein
VASVPWDVDKRPGRAVDGLLTDCEARLAVQHVERFVGFSVSMWAWFGSLWTEHLDDGLPTGSVLAGRMIDPQSVSAPERRRVIAVRRVAPYCIVTVCGRSIIIYYWCHR